METNPPPDQFSPNYRPPSARPWGRFVIIMLFFAFLLSPFTIIGLIAAPGLSNESKTLVIPRGTSAHEIAEMLDKNDIIYSSTLFHIATRLIAAGSLQAGEYQFSPHQSIADIVLMMHDGKSIIHFLTAAEGLSSSDIVALLRSTTLLTGDIAETPAEGSLLPETYRYSYGDSRMSVIIRMQKARQELLSNLWATRNPDIFVKSPHDALVMASIIEKETGKSAERPRIAGVFYNRLRTNMRLQSDPTVIYAIMQAKGRLDHELEHDDLSFSSPINTYTSDGLPPQPICNPGRAAIEAALHPELNDYFYFVADGTGGHVFAHDLTAHNQNVTRYRNQKSH